MADGSSGPAPRPSPRRPPGRVRARSRGRRWRVPCARSARPEHGRAGSAIGGRSQHLVDHPRRQAERGSSSISRRGPPSAPAPSRASAARRRSSSRRAGGGARPGAGSREGGRRRRRAFRAEGQPAAELEVLRHGHPREQLPALGDEGEAAAHRDAEVSAGGSGRRRASPGRSAASSPAIAFRSVVLPAPFGPRRRSAPGAPAGRDRADQEAAVADADSPFDGTRRALSAAHSAVSSPR